MAPKYTADERKLTIVLDGGTPLIVNKFYGEEMLSASTIYTTGLVSHDPLSKDLLSKEACVTFESEADTFFFPGIITHIEYIDHSLEKTLHYYKLQLQDPLSLLAYRYNRRIFQKKSTKDIIQQILSDLGIQNYIKFSSSCGAGKTHPFCTQMDETDLAFIQRLLASEGWHYHFDRSGQTPSVIIGSSNDDFTTAKNANLGYRNTSEGINTILNDWTMQETLNFNKVSLAEHSQDLAEILLSGEEKSKEILGNADQAYYQFGQGISDKGELRDLAKVQMQALDTNKRLSRSKSSYPYLSAGITFTLKHHVINDLNQEYFIKSITHAFERHAGEEVKYQNTFLCLPTSYTFRPKAIAKPLVHSIHSAKVTGPSNEEIFKGDMGQIKVLFHWDREGKEDENASCWLPVSQGMAGNGFGMQFTPRVGDEVLVQYINADPDFPVVIGSIYNKLNAPPYESQTQNGIKTRSSPQGASDMCNELRFEDKKDSEEVFLQAQKDLLVNVKNDSTTTITGNSILSTEKATTFNSKENFTINGEKDVLVNSKANVVTKADKNIQLEASSNLGFNANSNVTVDGQSIKITGKSLIELVVGASKISISSTGIIIDSPMVDIKGKMFNAAAKLIAMEAEISADFKSKIMTTVEGGAMTNLKASGMVEIKGAITKVN